MVPNPSEATDPGVRCPPFSICPEFEAKGLGAEVHGGHMLGGAQIALPMKLKVLMPGWEDGSRM